MRPRMAKLAKFCNVPPRDANLISVNNRSQWRNSYDRRSGCLSESRQKTFQRLAQRGLILGFKPSGEWCFRRIELGRWISEKIAEKKLDKNERQKNNSILATLKRGAAKVDAIECGKRFGVFKDSHALKTNLDLLCRDADFRSTHPSMRQHHV